jgi:hypothetical protein
MLQNYHVKKNSKIITKKHKRKTFSELWQEVNIMLCILINFYEFVDFLNIYFLVLNDYCLTKLYIHRFKLIFKEYLPSCINTGLPTLHSFLILSSKWPVSHQAQASTQTASFRATTAQKRLSYWALLLLQKWASGNFL